MLEGAAAPSYPIRSGDMCAARGRSLPRPVGDSDRRSTGNRKKRHRRDYASSPEGCKSLPISFGVCPKGAREMMPFRSHPMQGCDSRLASLLSRALPAFCMSHAGLSGVIGCLGEHQPSDRAKWLKSLCTFRQNKAFFSGWVELGLTLHRSFYRIVSVRFFSNGLRIKQNRRASEWASK